MMHRRVWLLGGTVAALIAVVAASAMIEVDVSAASERSAAAFSAAWAHVPRTTAGRKAKSVLVFGVEQDINGFNTNLACCSQLIGGFMGAVETQHGAFLQNDRGVWVRDLVSSASATKTSLTYRIKPSASWYWGGKKIPVTYRDFVYTLQKLDDPASLVASRIGYSNIDPTNFTHRGLKQITFHWKTTGCTQTSSCGPYARWQSLFGGLYPAAALVGQDFNTLWTSCICGSDGKPVSDGPFYLSNYTKGQGSTLKANPFWHGKKPGLAEVDFKVITDSRAEVQAMRSGQVDAITPTFGGNLLALKGQSGIVYSQIPGYYLEHLEFREGKGSSNPLLRAPWMRQAIGLAIDRASIIKTVYGDLADGIHPMDNMIYYSTQAGYKPDFAQYSFNQRKALVLLKKHCRGGPSTPGAVGVWTCAGFPATFRWAWTPSNAARTTNEAIIKTELAQIGISITEQPMAANVFFGPTGIPGGDFDIAEFAQITSGDPGDWLNQWRCGGSANYAGYCSKEASALMTAANAELNPTKRKADFQAADKLMSASVPAFPMYQRPVPLIYKSGILGMKNNPGSSGPFWNIEDWKWKS
jgi:peptide/nickel transport system substrate-binding protein